MDAKTCISVINLGSHVIQMMVVDANNPIRVLVVEQAPSAGIEHGAIVDLNAATEVIKGLLEVICEKLNRRIQRVYCSIAGGGMQALNSHGVVKIRNQEVCQYQNENNF